MLIGGHDILFKYEKDYAHFISEMLLTCLKHWPGMMVEFDTYSTFFVYENTFFVYENKESFLAWDLEGASAEEKNHQMIMFMHGENSEISTMVVDVAWEENTAANIVKEIQNGRTSISV